jgi:endonuclease-3 related protein
MKMNDTIYNIYKILLNHYGKQNWWPAETRYEVVVGAVLTQNTSWKNVERAINNLKMENLLEEEKILNIDEDKLKQLIKPAGFYNLKAKRLKNVTKFIVDNYGNTEEMAKTDKDTLTLRTELLSINGVGKETADSILLYALDRESFVVDAYTKRMFVRLGIIDEKAKYDDIKVLFERHLPKDLEVYKEYHALIVEHCKRFCRKKPLCDNCPIRTFCKLLSR